MAGLDGASAEARSLLPVDEPRWSSGSEEDVLSEEVAMQEDARSGRREMVARPRQARSSFGRVEVVEHDKRLLGVSPPRLVARKQAGESSRSRASAYRRVFWRRISK